MWGVLGLISIVVVLVGIGVAGALVYRKHWAQIESIKANIDGAVNGAKDLFSKKAE